MTPKNTNTLRPKSHVTHSDLRTWRVAKTFLAYSMWCASLSCHVLKGLPRGSSNENLLEIKRYPIISVLASWWIPCTTSSNGPNDTITCTIYGKPILSYLSHLGSLQAFFIFARPFSYSYSGLPCLLHGFQGWTRCSWSRTRDLNPKQEIPRKDQKSMAFRFTRRAIWPSILRHHIAWICKLGLTWKLNTNPWKKRFQHVWTFAPASWENTTWDLLQLI